MASAATARKKVCPAGNVLPPARMRGAIGLKQSRAIDGRVDLCRRQRGVPEQFLDGAQIAAAPQQMRREGVPQRMRRRAIWKPERATQPLDRELNDSWAERPAPG